MFIIIFLFQVIDGNEIVYRDYVDISVAVASPRVIYLNESQKSISNENFSLGFGCTSPSKC
jgi:hypothetical protein